MSYTPGIMDQGAAIRQGDDRTVSTLFFLGSYGPFSLIVLESLLASGQTLVGVGVPGEGAWSQRLLPPAPLPGGVPLLPSFVEQTIVTRAWQAGLPVWSIGAWDGAFLAALRAAQLAAIVVACWPRRLPDALLDLPRWGCLNVHPSRLPAYRGPAPLFWQLRDGHQSGGVTIHRMASELDAGPLLAQAPCPLPEGASGQALDRQLAQAGARILLQTLEALAAGKLVPRPQPPGGSYHPWPGAADFVLSRQWSARHAWSFMRGTEEWGHPFQIPFPERTLLVPRALAVAPRATLSAPWVARGEQIAVQFAPGILLLPQGEWR